MCRRALSFGLVAVTMRIVEIGTWQLCLSIDAVPALQGEDRFERMILDFQTRCFLIAHASQSRPRSLFTPNDDNSESMNSTTGNAGTVVAANPVKT